METSDLLKPDGATGPMGVSVGLRPSAGLPLSSLVTEIPLAAVAVAWLLAICPLVPGLTVMRKLTVAVWPGFRVPMFTAMGVSVTTAPVLVAKLPGT